MSWWHHLFLPRESNNYKAKILHPGSLSLLVGLFLFFQSSLNFFAVAVPSVLGYASDITPEKIIELTNQKRAEKGLSSLTLNPLLSQAAQRKAGDMFAFDYWDHSSPSGRDPWSFFKEVDYQYLYAGENLARDFADSEGAVSAWLASPTHKDNILNSRYQEIGVAVVNGTLKGMETTLVVQLFGTPTGAVAPATRLSASMPAIGLEAASIFAEIVSLPQAALTNPFVLTKTLAVFILGFLFGVMVVEVMIIRHHKVARLSGRNFAHTAFLGSLILIIAMMRQGAIL